jgi:NADH:ubiquinone oxidoreductase subunit 6 (subunit J)
LKAWKGHFILLLKMILTLSRLFRALTLRARVSLLFATHPVSAVISLVQVFVARGRFLRTLGLDFFSFTYIVVYVGAIAVLFLFVIMLLDTRAGSSTLSDSVMEEKKKHPLTQLFPPLILLSLRRRFFRRLRTMLGGTNGLESRMATFSAQEAWNLEEVDRLPTGPLLGMHLYTTHRIDFYLCAFLLLVAMIGSIEISMAGTTFEQPRKQQEIFQQMARDEFRTLRNKKQR